MENHQKPQEVAVVVVPIPSQSHLNQLLQLAALISSHGGLPVHYVGSATHNRQVKLRGPRGLKPNIHFHDLPTPPIASPDPNRNSSDKHPSHIGPATLAYLELHNPIAAVVRDLSVKTRRIVIIYDRLIAEAVKVAVTFPNVESYAFNCFSAFNLFLILYESIGKPFDVDEELNGLPSVTECFPEPIINFIVRKPDHFRERKGDIHNTARLIEDKYLDLLSREEIDGNKKQWAINPTLRTSSFKNEEHRERSKCLNWLDKQDPNSVIYVSFGTLVSLSDEEVREIALGLEESKTKFIWLLKNADKTDIFAEAARIELPEGFEERVREIGIVEREWVPQMEILSHESIGGFMSHCGWNSCFESLIAGVPVAAWPMHSDQQLNAVFLTEFVRTGLMVREWRKREELVEAAAVKGVVKRLMSEEGEEVRNRAAEISAAVRESVEKGGEFWREVDSFIAHITR
ncbi:hypothetical protein ACS0TY_011623 [Phlomoides rotata]